MRTAHSSKFTVPGIEAAHLKSLRIALRLFKEFLDRLFKAFAGMLCLCFGVRYAGETGTRKNPQQRMSEKCLCAAPAHVHPAHAAFCCWSTACSPARSAGWPHGPCLTPAPFDSRRAILDLACCKEELMFLVDEI